MSDRIADQSLPAHPNLTMLVIPGRCSWVENTVFAEGNEAVI
jgi:hypothetical protein